MKGLILLIAIIPYSPTAEDRSDLLWLEHFYDENGRKVFDQLLVADWDGERGMYLIRAWRLIKSDSQVPARHWPSGGWEASFVDGDFIRRIRAHSFRENWSQVDSELEQRQIYPKEKRRELRSVKP